MLWPRTGRPLPHPTFTKVTFTCYEAVKEIIRRYPLRMLVPLAVTATRVYIQRRRRAFMYNDCVKPTRRRAAGGHGAGPGGREAVRSRATARRSSTAPGQKPAGTSRSRYLPRCGIIIIIIIILASRARSRRGPAGHGTCRDAELLLIFELIPSFRTRAIAC